MEVQNSCGGAPTRAGNCRQCGQCCRHLGWLLVHADDGAAEWIRAHDPEIRVVSDEDVKDYHWVSIPYPCKQLVDLGDGRYSCKLHDKKPLVCKQYPLPSDELKPGCGYAFTSTPKSADS